MMDISQAQQSYQSILNNVDKKQALSFLRWAKQATETALIEVETEYQPQETVILRAIQADLRQSLPVQAVLDSETIVCPSVGENADCNQATTVHVDSFLYDEAAVDDLVDDGKMSRNYCRNCGSHQVSPLTFVSHSISQSQLQYIFQFLLPDLRGKLLLDIGSRLGPVLYGAHLYSGASKIMGVEMNRDLCLVQQKVVEKYNMMDRIQVVCDDICNQLQLLASADVVVMNNVFEFFADAEKQRMIWDVIQKSVRKSGSLLVTTPSLESSLQSLNLLPLLEGWVEPVSRPNVLQTAEAQLFSDPDDSDLSDIYLYKVL